MAEHLSATAPQVEQLAVKPKGILPPNLQNWFLVGGGILVVLFILSNSGGTSAKAKKASSAEAAKPVVIDPSQTRIQEYRDKIDTEARKLEAEEEQLKEVQQSLGVAPGAGQRAGALQAVYPPEALNQLPVMPADVQNSSVDPVRSERDKREYASLFASNLALSLRPSPAAGVASERGEVAEAEKARSVVSDSVPQVAPPSPFPASSVTSSSTANSSAHVEEEGEGSADPEKQKAQAPKKAEADVELRRATGSNHRLFEGTVLETVLTNRIAGDFSGPVNCLVSTNVYSHNRQHLLIPQGSRVLGEVKRVTNFGQERVAVIFHRLIMPDGFSVNLDQFQGLNQIGETGLKDQVNHHYVAIFGSSLALGAIAGFSQAGTTGGITVSGTDSYREGFASSLSQSSQRILDRFLNQLPTITIREGYRVKIVLAGDLVLPDYGMHRIKDDL